MWEVFLIFVESLILSLSFYLIPKNIRDKGRNDHSVIIYRLSIMFIFVIFVILLHECILQFKTISIFELWGLTNPCFLFPVIMASIHLLILYFGYFVESYYYGKEIGYSVFSIINHYSINNPLLFIRDCIAGPFMEEVLYRGTMLLFLLHRNYSLKQAIWFSSLSFGSCHLHRIFDFIQMKYPIKQAILSCLGMAIYTTLFGVLNSYIYVRTGSLLAAIVIHGMCNYLSIPSFSFWNSPKRYIILISYVVGIVLYICLFTTFLNPILLKSSFASLL